MSLNLNFNADEISHGSESKADFSIPIQTPCKHLLNFG